MFCFCSPSRLGQEQPRVSPPERVGDAEPNGGGLLSRAGQVADLVKAGVLNMGDNAYRHSSPSFWAMASAAMDCPMVSAWSTCSGTQPDAGWLIGVRYVDYVAGDLLGAAGQDEMEHDLVRH